MSVTTAIIVAGGTLTDSTGTFKTDYNFKVGRYNYDWFGSGEKWLPTIIYVENINQYEDAAA